MIYFFHFRVSFILLRKRVEETKQREIDNAAQTPEYKTAAAQSCVMGTLGFMN